MDKRFIPEQYETKLYSFWKQKSLLKPNKSGKPFTILMPPPNANASLHAGHGMYVIDDILIRYKRIKGYSSLWVPGMDHAGFETQFVYEKHLRKVGKSRLEFDRQTLYKNIFDFVKENSGLIYQQFCRLGFLADWERSVFTLDDHVLNRVYETFIKMVKEGYIYRDDYIVNYCNYCGTSLSEVEVVHNTRRDPLYFLQYGPLKFATVRPETVFADVALAVNPNDKRYQKYVGQTLIVDNLFWIKEIPVVADNKVDPKFGTGVVKVTPAHDPADFSIGKTNNLSIKTAIDRYGRLTEICGKYKGMKVKAAREQMVKDMKTGVYKDFFVEEKDYEHAVTVCYKCQRDLEPTVIPNWFIKVVDLKKPVIKAIKKDEIKFHPKRFKKQILQWLEQMHDWPISRQIVWGIRIPVWYQVDGNENKIWVSFIDKQGQFRIGVLKQFLEQGIALAEIKQGLQRVEIPIFKEKYNDVTYKVSKNEPKDNHDWIMETDTFDTWFSSGQWPLVTLKEEEYTYRFPTEVMGTLSDILPFWVSRMIMFSLYIRHKVPFKHVYLWSAVVDAKGQKMSKSKGNVINPIDLVDKYGADAFRGALVFGVGEGSKIPLSEEKVKAMRNFANKIWNIGRLLNLSFQDKDELIQEWKFDQKQFSSLEKKMLVEFKRLENNYHRYMTAFKFSQAFGELYEFIWHTLADNYLEALKPYLRNGKINTLKLILSVFEPCLQMLHPFMPFVTEAIYQEFKGNQASLLVDKLKIE